MSEINQALEEIAYTSFVLDQIVLAIVRWIVSTPGHTFPKSKKAWIKLISSEYHSVKIPQKDLYRLDSWLASSWRRYIVP